MPVPVTAKQLHIQVDIPIWKRIQLLSAQQKKKLSELCLPWILEGLSREEEAERARREGAE